MIRNINGEFPPSCGIQITFFRLILPSISFAGGFLWFFFSLLTKMNQELVVDSEMFSSQFPARVGLLLLLTTLLYFLIVPCDS